MAYRDSTSSAGSGAVSNHTINWPTVAAGDRAYIVASADGSGGLYTAPAGFTQIATGSIAAPDSQAVFVWEKKNCTGSESGSVAVNSSNGSTGQMCLAMVTFSGRDTSAAATFISTISTSATSNATPVSMAATSGTAVAGDDLFSFFATDQDGSGAVWNFTAPSGFTERQDIQAADWSSLELATQDNVSAGAVGTVTGTATRTSGTGGAGWLAFIIAVPVSASAPTASSGASQGTALSAASGFDFGAGVAGGLGLVRAAAVGGYRYSANLGTATLDFGQGNQVASVVVTDQIAIASGAYVEAFMQGDSTIYHNAYEHLTVPMRFVCGDIVNGVGFTITGVSPYQLTGQFVVHYVWSA